MTEPGLTFRTPRTARVFPRLLPVATSDVSRTYPSPLLYATRPLPQSLSSAGLTLVLRTTVPVRLTFFVLVRPTVIRVARRCVVRPRSVSRLLRQAHFPHLLQVARVVELTPPIAP